MSTEPAAIAIDDDVLRAAYRAALEAFPRECCGWLTGSAARADAIRPCQNLQGQGYNPITPDRDAESAYVIDGDDLKAFLRGLKDGPTPRVIYHSHPNGRAYFSATDKQASAPWGDAPSYDVQQLVIGVDGALVVEAALFAWSEAAGDFVEVARLAGTDP